VEFQYPLELAKAILTRETVKKELTQQSQVVWEKRAVLADLKRKCPSLGDKNDEELLIDKERPAKRLETTLVACSLRKTLFLTDFPQTCTS
jgi:enhancer of polycomb-like protein